MSQLLQRITTEFSPEQDRIRIAGVTNGGRQQVMWLSRRMLSLLLPTLLKHLDEQFPNSNAAHADILQEFAQRAAFEALDPAEPVRPTSGDAAMLITSVDFVFNADELQLTFRDAPEGGCRLTFGHAPLRQWLQMLYQLEQQANWQLPVWPAWLTGVSASHSAPSASLH